MIGWGILLVILGAGSLALPAIGYNFQIMELVDDFQPWAGIAVAVIGAALIFPGMNRRRPAPPAAPPPQG
jgi:hypothetical protein